MSRLHISASSGLHCPLLTSFPSWDKKWCREQTSWGWKCPLLCPDSWITLGTDSWRVCPGQGSFSQLLPETPVRFFSTGRAAWVEGWVGTQQWRRLYFHDAPSCAPLHSWFSGLLAEHMNVIGRVARVMQEDTNALLINPSCLSPSDLTALNLMHLPALGYLSFSLPASSSCRRAACICHKGR